MLIMPILNTSKNGITKIYNVEITLKNAKKVKENTKLKGFSESDVIVNGTSFNNSIFNTKSHEDNVVVNFIRSINYKTDKKDFLITTRTNSNKATYDLYNVAMPPRKVSSSLDNLYGKAIIDMQKEIPNIKKGRYLSLKQLGINSHLTDEKLGKLKYIVENTKEKERLEYLFLINGVGDLRNIIDYFKLFNFTIISEATIKEEDFLKILDAFNYTSSKDCRSLNKYYIMAKENQDIYRRLTILNRILYKKNLNLIN